MLRRLFLVLALALNLVIPKGLDSKIYPTQSETQPVVERLGRFDKKTLNDLINESKSINSVSERILYFYEAFLDLPYKQNSLGGGLDKKESLTVDLEGMDCVTVIDYSLALANADDYDDFLGELKRIRYKNDGAVVSWSARNHYSTDWVKENHEYVTDITSKLKHEQADITLNYLENQGIPSKKTLMSYVPKDEMASVGKQFQNGDLVFFTTSEAGLGVGHAGIIKIEDGKTKLLHASLAKNKLVKEELFGYLSKIRKFYGVIIARAK